VEHENGPVDIRGAERSVTVSIKNGDVKVHYDQFPRDASTDLSTSNGDLELAVPRDASLQVDAQTSAGEVFVRGLTFDPQRLTPLRAGARYTAQRGAGDATVTLRTENGSIVLRESTPILPSERTMTEPADTTRAAPDTTDAMPDTAQADPASPTESADTTSNNDARLGPVGPGDEEAEAMPPPDSLDPPTPAPEEAVTDTTGANR
jgi:hypothetical protein